MTLIQLNEYFLVKLVRNIVGCMIYLTDLSMTLVLKVHLPDGILIFSILWERSLLADEVLLTLQLIHCLVFGRGGALANMPI